MCARLNRSCMAVAICRRVSFESSCFSVSSIFIPCTPILILSPSAFSSAARTQSAEFVVFHPNQDSWRTFNVVRNARVTAQIFAEREAEVAAAAAAQAAAAARSP